MECLRDMCTTLLKSKQKLTEHVSPHGATYHYREVTLKQLAKLVPVHYHGVWPAVVGAMLLVAHHAKPSLALIVRTFHYPTPNSNTTLFHAQWLIGQQLTNTIRPMAPFSPRLRLQHTTAKSQRPCSNLAIRAVRSKTEESKVGRYQATRRKWWAECCSCSGVGQSCQGKRHAPHSHWVNLCHGISHRFVYKANHGRLSRRLAAY